MINTIQQEKQAPLEYRERLKQEKSTVKSSIGENFLDSFVKTTKEFKKFDEVNDADKIINMKIN